MEGLQIGQRVAIRIGPVLTLIEAEVISLDPLEVKIVWPVRIFDLDKQELKPECQAKAVL